MLIVKNKTSPGTFAGQSGYKHLIVNILKRFFKDFSNKEKKLQVFDDKGYKVPDNDSYLKGNNI